MIQNLFFHLLPVQILVFTMGSINSIVDGTIAGQFIDASTVGVIGLYYSLASIIIGAGNMLLGGTAVLCGRFMGRGELEKTSGVFSLNLTLTFLIGLFFTLLSLLIPTPLARLLGANEWLAESLRTYIIGYAIGIIPMMLAQQLAAFLQMERQNLRSYLGIGGMIFSNIALNILFIVVFRMGVFGLALATSLSNIIYCLILLPYYFTKKAQLRFHKNRIPWKTAPTLLKIGFPGALLVFCLALRGPVINRLLLQVAGSDGLSAMSALNMVNGLFIAYCLANGAVVRMLTSVFAGEEDKASLKQVLGIALTKGLLLSLLITGLVLLLAAPIASIFFPDSASPVYTMTRRLFMIYGACIPLILICQVSTNYFQAMGHNLFVNAVSVFDGFFAMVIPALALAPILGATGIWIAAPIGILLTILLVPLYGLLYWKRLPKTREEWMFLKPDFGVPAQNTLDLAPAALPEVARTAETVQAFCQTHNIDSKTAFHAALCLEEMAGNVVRHGFSFDKKKHSLSVRLIRKNDGILLRLKDDCPPFNPREMARLYEEQGGTDNLGIRMVEKLADEINYQNLLGLNVLSIHIQEEDLRVQESTDFLLEKTLKALDPGLHSRFRDTILVARQILSRYKLLFPEYTDHSEFHSLNVVDACNRLIGREQIHQLNKDEIYILLVSCYLHDVGMGISEKDYNEFKQRLGEEAYFAQHPGAEKSDFVRDKHNDFSGLFIEKYAELFDFPSPEHTFAIRQTARGHRKTDLYNEEEYPAVLALPNGNTVCLPYLAALIRIADEIDVVATRNPLLLYDLGALTDEKQILENKKLYAVKSMKMTREAFILTAETQDPQVRALLEEMAEKMRKTLLLCREVIHSRTGFHLNQEKVVLQFKNE